MNAITLLNDGETYTGLEGTSVVFLNDANLELLNEGSSMWRYLEKYDLTNPVHLRMLADKIERQRGGL